MDGLSVRTSQFLGLVALPLLLFSGGAWATPDCSREGGSRPHPELPAGTPDSAIPIEHIVIIVQENHSFDSYFGKLNDPKYYGAELDGVDESMSNPDSDGNPVHIFHQEKYCVSDPRHEWDDLHKDWNEGRMNGFYVTNTAEKKDGRRALGYYTDEDLNYYYALANEFAVSDRYFSSVLGPTLPNRYFMMAGTAFGHVMNDFKVFHPFKQKTIFNTLQENKVSWKYYYADWSYLGLFDVFWKNLSHVAQALQFKYDLNHGKLPAVSFVESSVLGSDEHPPGNIQTGQKGVAKHIRDLMKSPYWKNTVLFFTYDENGGYFDHVSPPEACIPDDIPPDLGGPAQYPATYDHYGFRVPFIAISPFAKRHYVSHQNADHSSVLKFIERKFNLPALTRRDANADPMLDLFDFDSPRLDIPNLPKPSFDWRKALSCIIPLGQ